MNEEDVNELRTIILKFDTTNALVRTIRTLALAELEAAEKASTFDEVNEHLRQIGRLIDAALHPD